MDGGVRKVVIDGYNLLYAAGLMHESKKLSPAQLRAVRGELLSHLVRHVARRSRRVVVVFDSRGTEQRGCGREQIHFDPAFPNIEVRYAEDADNNICEMLSGESNPRSVLVVSSDREVASAARICGARRMSSEEFWDNEIQARAKLDSKHEAPEKPHHVSQAERDYWLKEFGEGGNGSASRRLR